MSMRIGIPLVGGTHWHGGITYLEAIIRAFRALPQDEQPKLYLLIGKSHERDLSAHSYFLSLLDGFIVIGYMEALPEEISKKARLFGTFHEAADHVDFIFPVNSDCLPGYAYASWLPDFQHRHLPQLFSAADFLLREDATNFVLTAADNIVVSSETAKKDLIQYYSPYSGKVEVVPFFSRFDPDCFEQNPIVTASSYQLPERYLICCNQFWQHKNHAMLIRAIALTEHPVQLVCTGAEEDYRNKDWLAQLKSLISELGVGDRISLLGFIPRVDQIQLMRRSLAIVQPSLFEGWSTVMEDARGLGKMVIASDLEVHREQAVPNVHYFDTKSASELAVLLDQAYIEQLPGPDVTAERKAQEEVGRRQINSARKLLGLIDRAIHIHELRKFSSTGGRSVCVERHQTSRILQLNEELVEKEELAQAKHEALVRLTESLEEKHEGLMRLTESLVEKEAVIQELSTALEACRSSLLNLDKGNV